MSGVALMLLTAYFFPFMVAVCRGHKNSGAIFVINLFLGWTLIGWVVALSWACSACGPERKRQVKQGE